MTQTDHIHKNKGMIMPKASNIPNLLTGYRFAVILPLLLCLRPETTPRIGMVAFILFLSAALTDLADGYLARKFQAETVLGKLLDPLADKVLVTVALVMLIPMARVPAWLCFFILSREMIITGLRSVAAASGTVISASQLGKYKSVAQLTALSILIYPPELSPFPHLHLIGSVVLYLALFLTVWSGIQYFHRFRKVYLR
ncbi:MAG: CDP-diacylglycerol--glycerol-3-phosphate 3-phosphatidyltransferase [Desulfurivibrionaceae bacterium]